MIGSALAFGKVNGRGAAALIKDGALDDVLIDPPEDIPVPGTIYRAIADRPAKGLGGQFLRLPGGLKGFLRQGQLPAGRHALVQVTGFAEVGKAIPVTAKLLFKGRHVIITPNAKGINVSRQIRDEDRQAALKDLVVHASPNTTGLILRSAAEDAKDDLITEEVLALQGVADAVLADPGDRAELLLDGPSSQDIAWMDWDHDGSPVDGFEAFDVEDLIDQMRSPLASVGHASAYIEPTRAFVAIDVNTGGDTSPAAGLKANIAVARDLPRQLRCRGLGGQIVIDFATFPKKDRKPLEHV